MSTALVAGSVAYDIIMRFSGRFSDHILPDKIHELSVAFMVDEVRREYGGCAGNIAYTLNLLGETAIPIAAVGRDFSPYAEWMDANAIARDYILELPDVLTAQAYINTDDEDNQITAFHPGAMSRAHEQSLPTNTGAQVGIVSPDGRDAMIQRASEFAEAGVPFMFDPGQGLPLFDAPALVQFLRKARWLAMNDYEAGLMRDRMGVDLEQMVDGLEAVVVTRGSKGSLIYADNVCYEIPAVPAASVVDPTGCGDAYRAGLLFGILSEYDWETTGRIAALAGSIKVATRGTQNHRFTPEEFEQWFREFFGYTYR